MSDLTIEEKLRQIYESVRHETITRSDPSDDSHLTLNEFIYSVQQAFKSSGYHLDSPIQVSDSGKRLYMSVEDQELWDGTTWKVHLQQAVVSEDPIDYMYEAVFGERP